MGSKAPFKRIVVIGAGQAGYQVCVSLRDLMPDCAITLVGDESQGPYERPPLSKGYLLGEIDKAGLSIREEEYYKRNAIELILGVRCTRIQASERCICLDSGIELPYDALVLATGSAPIVLPEKLGGALRGVYCLRSVADADRLTKQLQPGRSMLIVGGGYIGLEMAAVASQLGLKVTVVEASERVLSRVACEHVSHYFRQLHKDHGVDIREGIQLDGLLGVEGRLVAGRLSDGSDIQSDIAVVGIGIRPCTELAESAALEVGNGIRVNAQCQTSDPSIFAIGDCAEFPQGDRYLRLESVGNAIDMGVTAAHVIAGRPRDYVAKPRFWSDQYKTSLQIVGLSEGYDNIVVRDGDSQSVSFWYYAKEQLLAVDVINDPRTFSIAKRLIEQGKSPKAEDIQDLKTNLKRLLK